MKRPRLVRLVLPPKPRPSRNRNAQRLEVNPSRPPILAPWTACFPWSEVVNGTQPLPLIAAGTVSVRLAAVTAGSVFTGPALVEECRGTLVGVSIANRSSEIKYSLVVLNQLLFPSDPLCQATATR